ncbi:MAG: cytochrome C oxidase subunit II [Anaerolineae bacterium]|nr:cytochrome C oxidase subunit II [Anaerolineae bacterium]
MHIERFEKLWIYAFVVMLAVFVAALMAGAILFNVRVPGSAGLMNPADIPNSEFANPGVRDMGDGNYNVYVVARMWAFQPSEIVLPEGANVTFYVTSADITHGFIIEHHNANLEVIPGVIGTTRVTFPSAGTFKLQCHEYCGRGHQLMHIDIIVEETQVALAANEE